MSTNASGLASTPCPEKKPSTTKSASAAGSAPTAPPSTFLDMRAQSSSSIHPQIRAGLMIHLSLTKKPSAGRVFSWAAVVVSGYGSAADHQQYFPSSISLTATSWRAAVVLKGSVLVNRLRPISIILSSSPSANASNASLPEECMRSATS